MDKKKKEIHLKSSLTKEGLHNKTPNQGLPKVKKKK